jgi:glutamate carboxypeptidase
MIEELSRLLDHYESQIYDDFERIVNINSFSTYPAGIERMHDALQELAHDLDVTLESIYSSQKSRPHLVYGRSLERNFYAMVGHFDTVHPPHSDFQEMWTDGSLLRGPGTNDMKSGLIVAIYALAILQKLFPGKTLPLKALFNSDEEIGSPDSEEIIKTIFVGAKAGFVFEPGRIEQNSLVTSRKGIFGLSVEIAGKPSHAGTAPEKGINAIVEAARIITELEKLNDLGKGISIGCNRIEGGVAVNVVAPSCKVGVDARYIHPAQEKQLLGAVEKILTAPTSTGATVTYEILHGRPPLEKTEASEKLYQKYKAISESLGIGCGEMSTGGGSDANFLSAIGIPVIDGVGAVGNHSHTKEEYTIKNSIIERIKIFCLLMAQEIDKE